MDGNATGGIYVIELRDGLVKVGQSSRIGTRLRNHAAVVEGYELEAVEVWTRAVADPAAAERKLVHALVRHPGAEYTNSGREVWRGVSLWEVVTLARAVLAGQGAVWVPAPIKDESAPIDPETPEPLLTLARLASTGNVHTSTLLAELDGWTPRTIAEALRPFRVTAGNVMANGRQAKGYRAISVLQAARGEKVRHGR